MDDDRHDGSQNHHTRTGPESLYHRQMERDHLTSAWFDLLDLTSGTQLVDVGSGPGRIAVLGAERVGPGGAVYALDSDPAALAYLERTADAAVTEHVHPIVTDATTLAVTFDRPVVALVALMLHHVGDPLAVFESVNDALAADSRVLVVEYRPDAPGAVGPPLARRIAPARIEDWLGLAGLTVEARHEFDDECYGVVART